MENNKIDSVNNKHRQDDHRMDSPPSAVARSIVSDSDSDESETDEVKEFIRQDELMSADGTHEITLKELRRYNKQVDASDGFDVAYFPKVAACNMITPVRKLTPEKLLLFSKYAKFALMVYKIMTGISVEFVEIIKVNFQGVCGFQYYITFEVKPADDSPNKIFQALVLFGVQTVSVELVRPKPNQ